MTTNDEGGGEACAHLNVRCVKTKRGGRTVGCRWLCGDCGTEFLPRPKRVGPRPVATVPVDLDPLTAALLGWQDTKVEEAGDAKTSLPVTEAGSAARRLLHVAYSAPVPLPDYDARTGEWIAPAPAADFARLREALVECQDLFGEVATVYENDRAPDRADRLQPLYKRGFDLCVAVLAAFGPNIGRRTRRPAGS